MGGNCNVDGSEGGASPILADIDNNSDVVPAAEQEERYLDPHLAGHYINYASHYRREKRIAHSPKSVLQHMYGSHEADVMKGSYEFTYNPYKLSGGGSGYDFPIWDVQCGFDQ